MTIQIRNDHGEVHEVELIRSTRDGWLEVADSVGAFDVSDAYLVDPATIGDPDTLCNSPRCSLGEGHTAPCDEFAGQPG
jgi:hypothetical protein